MSIIIYQVQGSFVRMHGIFGKTKRGTLLFTSEKLIVFNKVLKENWEGRESTEITASVEDELLFSQVSSCTKGQSLQTGRFTGFQIVTTDGAKINFQMNGVCPPQVEQLLSRRSVSFYRNNVEKRAGIETETSEILAFLDAKHISGLPIAEGIMCRIAGSKDEYLFKVQTQEYRLPMNRIKDVSIRTDTEVSKTYVSDIGNAILGAYFLGTAGAVIGGHAHEKTHEVKNHFLIFSYTKDNDMKYISFFIDNLKIATILTKLFQPQSGTVEKIDL